LFRFVSFASVCVLLWSIFLFPRLFTPEFYTLSLHDALPICVVWRIEFTWHPEVCSIRKAKPLWHYADDGKNLVIGDKFEFRGFVDRKSTRLNSSHQIISYAVFCLKKKIQHSHNTTISSRKPL